VARTPPCTPVHLAVAAVLRLLRARRTSVLLPEEAALTFQGLRALLPVVVVVVAVHRKVIEERCNGHSKETRRRGR